MSDYPTIRTLIKTDNVEENEPKRKKLDDQAYRENYFSNKNAREVMDYNFNFTHLQTLVNHQEDMDVIDIQRIGIIFIFHALIKYSPALTV